MPTKNYFAALYFYKKKTFFGIIKVSIHAYFRPNIKIKIKKFAFQFLSFVFELALGNTPTTTPPILAIKPLNYLW